MALTLIEAAKLHSGETLRAAIIELYAKSHPLLAALAFNDIPGNALRYNQEQSLPGIAFRGVNESYTPSTGVINPVVEPLVIAGGELDVDTFIVKTMGADQRAVQEEMKLKSLAHSVAHKVIKGDSETDPREFDGLQKRLTGNQLLAAGSTSGGNVLTLALLDELIDKVDEPTHLLMSKAVRRSLSVAARTTTVGGYVTYSTDAFGRQITKYNELPIIEMDPSSALYSTLAFNEANPGGGSAVGTSIYCVAIRDGYMTGIQNGAMEVEDLGILQTAPKYRTRIEWLMGMTLFNPRSAARLYGVKAGAVTA